MKNAQDNSLALLGGAKTITNPDLTLFHWPIITQEDEQAILDVVRAGTMSGTDITKAFEKEYADWVGVKHALGYCNGTASLLGAFWACGVGAGDEIICPSMTYWASAAPALSLGASVNFADIDPVTLCIDPKDIEHRICLAPKPLLRFTMRVIRVIWIRSWKSPSAVASRSSRMCPTLTARCIRGALAGLSEMSQQ